MDCFTLAREKYTINKMHFSDKRKCAANFYS